MNQPAHKTDLQNRTFFVPFYPSNFNGKEKDCESGFHYFGARYYWSEDNSEAAAHEAGHLLLLPDRYHKDDQSASGYSADPGWEGTIMAEPCGKGRVTQRDVNEVLDIMLNVN